MTKKNGRLDNNFTFHSVTLLSCDSLFINYSVLIYFSRPFFPSPNQLASWESTRGLNGSLKENRIESGMQGVMLKIVTLPVSCGSAMNLLTLDLSGQICE